MRKRSKTESFGCLLTMHEREIMRAYLRERRLTATEYLRQAAIQPIMEAAQQASEVGLPDAVD
jgi:hypothetical protein